MAKSLLTTKYTRFIQKGDPVKIEPGVSHQALEEAEVPLEILVIATPPAIGDNYMV
jgi:mannose-6-phosphate isomerase-like protein (cupin superfamily)